jgi:hypothetical protein
MKYDETVAFITPQYPEGDFTKVTLCESLVTTAWNVLKLRMEEMGYRYGG